MMTKSLKVVLIPASLMALSLVVACGPQRRNPPQAKKDVATGAATNTNNTNTNQQPTPGTPQTPQQVVKPQPPKTAKEANATLIESPNTAKIKGEVAKDIKSVKFDLQPAAQDGSVPAYLRLIITDSANSEVHVNIADKPGFVASETSTSTTSSAVAKPSDITTNGFSASFNCSLGQSEDSHTITPSQCSKLAVNVQVLAATSSANAPTFKLIQVVRNLTSGNTVDQLDASGKVSVAAVDPTQETNFHGLIDSREVIEVTLSSVATKDQTGNSTQVSGAVTGQSRLFENIKIKNTIAAVVNSNVQSNTPLDLVADADNTVYHLDISGLPTESSIGSNSTRMAVAYKLSGVDKAKFDITLDQSSVQDSKQVNKMVLRVGSNPGATVALPSAPSSEATSAEQTRASAPAPAAAVPAPQALAPTPTNPAAAPKAAAKPAAKPVAITFNVSPTKIGAGEHVHLTWSAVGAKKVVLDDEVVAEQGSKEVAPDTVQTPYTLKVQVSEDPKDIKVITKVVNVDPNPDKCTEHWYARAFYPACPKPVEPLVNKSSDEGGW